MAYCMLLEGKNIIRGKRKEKNGKEIGAKTKDNKEIEVKRFFMRKEEKLIENKARSKFCCFPAGGKYPLQRRGVLGRGIFILMHPFSLKCFLLHKFCIFTPVGGYNVRQSCGSKMIFFFRL